MSREEMIKNVSRNTGLLKRHVDKTLDEFLQQITKGLKDRGIGILLTDHSVRETLTITDRAYIMAEGKILISGTAEELITDEKAREIYLGEEFEL